MSLFLFLVVIVSLSCGTLPPMEIPPTRPIVATMMLLTAWTMLCHIGVRMIAKQAIAGNMQPIAAVACVERQLHLFRWLGLPLIVLCLGGFGLARVLDGLPWISDTMAVRSVILLVPGLVVTIATWSAENYYGMLVGYAPRSLRAHLRAVLGMFRVGIAWLVIPVLAVMLVADLVGWLSLRWEFASWLMPIVVIIALPAFLPWLVRRIFKTEAVDAEHHGWIQEILDAMSVGHLRLARWNTDGKTYNAMVAGFVRPFRTLLLSDRLLDELPPDQLAMVVLHEVAHVKRKHVPIRMAMILPAWALGALFSFLANQHSLATALGTLAGIIGTIVGLRLVSYRTEFDADVQACLTAERLQITRPDLARRLGLPESAHAATRSLAAALETVTKDHEASRRPTWLHPGLSDRVDWLRKKISPPHSKAIAGNIAKPAYP
ncbi:MAG: M48 family metalloprotease [Planctomycetota bacterium]